MNDFKCQIHYRPWNDEPVLYFRVNTVDAKHYRLELKFVEYQPPAKDDDFEIKCNGISTPQVILQNILDACWNYGMRPTGFKSIEDQTVAIKEHLEDMRRIVMNSKAINWK